MTKSATEKRNEPSIVVERDDEVLLILSNGILGDVEILLGNNDAGNLLERGTSRFFQPGVLPFVPNDLHMERI